MLCQLGATVRLRDELESWLPGLLLEEEQEPEVQEPTIQDPEVQELEVQELAGEAPLGA